MTHKSDFGSGSVMALLIAMVLLSIITIAAAEASQEHRLSFSKFHLESENETDPGKVVITGSRDKFGAFRDLKVKFLGKDIDVPQSILEKIPASSNGIQISAAAGWEPRPSYEVYIVFLTGSAIVTTVLKRVVIGVTTSGKSTIIQY